MVFIVQRFTVPNDGSALAAIFIAVSATGYALGDFSTPVASVIAPQGLVSIQIIAIVTFVFSFRSTSCAFVPDFAVFWLGGLGTPDCYELGDNRVKFTILRSK